MKKLFALALCLVMLASMTSIASAEVDRNIKATLTFPKIP